MSSLSESTGTMQMERAARNAGEREDAANPPQPVLLLAEIREGLSKLRRAKDALSYWYVGRDISRLKAMLPHGNRVHGAGWTAARSSLVRKGFSKSTIENCIRIAELPVKEVAGMTYVEALVAANVRRPPDENDAKTHFRRLDCAITVISKSLLNLRQIVSSARTADSAEISKKLDISIACLQQLLIERVENSAPHVAAPFSIPFERRIS